MNLDAEMVFVFPFQGDVMEQKIVLMDLMRLGNIHKNV